MDSRALIWLCVGTIFTTAAFVGGFYLGSPGDVAKLPLSASQARKAAELSQELPSLQELRGPLFRNEKEGTAGFAAPRKSDYENWLHDAVWVAYDEGFDEGKQSGASLLPVQARELLLRYREALQLSNLLKGSVDGNARDAEQNRERLAQATAALVNAEWNAKHGVVLGLDASFFLQSEAVPAAGSSKRQRRSIESLQFELDLRKALAKADQPGAKARSEVVLVNRQP